jgi:hypothetical protein
MVIPSYSHDNLFSLGAHIQAARGDRSYSVSSALPSPTSRSKWGKYKLFRQIEQTKRKRSIPAEHLVNDRQYFMLGFEDVTRRITRGPYT